MEKNLESISYLAMNSLKGLIYDDLNMVTLEYGVGKIKIKFYINRIKKEFDENVAREFEENFFEFLDTDASSEINIIKCDDEQKTESRFEIVIFKKMAKEEYQKYE